MGPGNAKTASNAASFLTTNRVSRFIARTVRGVWQGSPLVQAFAQDRLLAVTTAVLAVAALLPMFVTPFLPLSDLPDHIGQGALLPEILLGRGLAAYHYKIQWAPVPYWTTHLIIAILSPIVGALAAAKIMVAMAVLGLPLAVMRVLRALGRDTRLGLWAFMASWDHNTFAGWIAFMLGMSAALWAIAWVLETQTYRKAIRIAFLACFLGLTHVQAVAYFGLALGLLLLVRRPFKRVVLLHTVAGSGTLISVMPWLVSRFSQSATQGATAWTFDFHTLREKIQDVFKYTLDDQARPADATVAGAVFLLLLLGVPLLASVPAEKEQPGELHPATGALLVIVPLFLYLTLPMAISGPVSHWYTYPRYATFWLVSLLFLPRARFGGWRALWLAPGVLGAIIYSLVIAGQFADYAQRSRPFLQIIGHVRPNSSYLPLELEDDDPAMVLAPFNQIHAYIAAVKKGYDPHLFHYDSIPFRFRAERELPQTAWNGARAFTIKDHGRFYDYVLVQGIASDPVAHAKPFGGVRARLVVEAGRFRLYAMEKAAP